MQITGVMPGDNQRMELHQLEYFVAVAEELSFTRGARRAHVVQSAVSAAITRLERELNAPLFERTRRRVALTDAGSALLPEARAALAAVQSARDAVAAVRGGLRGSVTLGMMLSTGPLDMAAVLGRVSAAHPDVVVQAPPGGRGHRGPLARPARRRNGPGPRRAGEPAPAGYQRPAARVGIPAPAGPAGSPL